MARPSVQKPKQRLRADQRLKRSSAAAAKATPDARPKPARAAAGTRIREVPAVRRATAILWHLARNATGLSLSQVARDLDILPSTCLHILRELINTHLVAFDSAGKTYKLGLGVLRLAKGLSLNDPFIQLVQPHLNRLVDELHMTASAQEVEGDHFVVVAAATPNEGIVGIVGSRRPCLSSATGRLVAAHGRWGNGELKAMFKSVRWQDAPDYQRWLEEVAAAKDQGYAVDNGQFQRGLISIAVPLLGRDGTLRRAISVNALAAQVDRTRRAACIKALRAAASDISAYLGD